MMCVGNELRMAIILYSIRSKTTPSRVHNSELLEEIFINDMRAVYEH